MSLDGPERGWNKLAVFSETLYDLKGKVLCLDLDLIITGSLDDLFDCPGEVMIIKDWIKKDGTGNSSVYRFEVGAHPRYLRNLGDPLNRSSRPIAMSRNICQPCL